MIIGIGIDIVDIARIKKIYEKFGMRFVGRYFTANEILAMPAEPAAYLAGRFAVKEACAKALATGFNYNILPSQIETVQTSDGAPVLNLYGHALHRANLLRVRRKHISISHEKSCAIAMAILED